MNEKTRRIRFLSALFLAASFFGVPGNAAAAASNPALRSVGKLEAATRNASIDAWKNARYRDAFLAMVDTARSAIADADTVGEKAHAAVLLKSAARMLDLLALRVDGSTGASDDAHLDDWVSPPAVANSLHAKAVQARSDCLRWAER